MGSRMESDETEQETASFRKAFIFPLLTFIVVPGSFLICYGIAVAENHVDALFPFISDTGTFPPESCVFGQLVNIAALMIGICVYLRHRQVVFFYQAPDGKRWRAVSTTFLWLGYIGAFGTSMVANCQETRCHIGHLIGASLTFVLGNAYCWGQSVFTYLMKPRLGGVWMAHLRTFLSAAGSICLIILLSTSYVQSILKNHQDSVRNNSTAEHRYIHWPKEKPGYAEHLTSTFAEWLLAGSFIAFIMTFAYELRFADITPPQIVIKHESVGITSEAESSRKRSNYSTLE